MRIKMQTQRETSLMVPSVGTVLFHCQRPRFHPWSGNQDSTRCTAGPGIKEKMIQTEKGRPCDDAGVGGDGIVMMEAETKVMYLVGQKQL